MKKNLITSKKTQNWNQYRNSTMHTVFYLRISLNICARKHIFPHFVFILPCNQEYKWFDSEKQWKYKNNMLDFSVFLSGWENFPLSHFSPFFVCLSSLYWWCWRTRLRIRLINQIKFNWIKLNDFNWNCF